MKGDDGEREKEEEQKFIKIRKMNLRFFYESMKKILARGKDVLNFVGGK